MKKLIGVFLLALCSNLSAAPFELALTFDDLPCQKVSVAQKLLKTFDKHGIKNVYGFINAREIINNDSYKVLTLWVNHGQLLGNHTYNHLDLNTHDATKFITQIQKNDNYLEKLMQNKDYHYFRYPYLHEGNTQEKRDAVRQYLFNHNYQIAQVTVDFGDYQWNKPYARCVKKGDKRAIEWLKKSYIEQALIALAAAKELSQLVFKRDIKNILLLHIGTFDALMMDDLLTAYKNHGVKFIPLTEAMQDKVYQINPNVVCNNTDIFTTQIVHAEKLPVSKELNLLLSAVPEVKLRHLCR